MGFDILSTETQIISVLIGDEEKGIQMSRLLFDRGIIAPLIGWPAVPSGRRGTPIRRVCLRVMGAVCRVGLRVRGVACRVGRRVKGAAAGPPLHHHHRRRRDPGRARGGKIGATIPDSGRIIPIRGGIGTPGMCVSVRSNASERSSSKESASVNCLI